MSSTPHDAMTISLTTNDVARALEYWLNAEVLKEPVEVKSVKALNAHAGQVTANDFIVGFVKRSEEVEAQDD